MGIGAATKQFITIGENCTIGGQAIITNTLLPNSKVAGVPAKKI
jgi:serine acetyltransferase